MYSDTNHKRTNTINILSINSGIRTFMLNANYVDEDPSLPVSYTMSTGKLLPTFRKSVLPPSSGSNLLLLSMALQLLVQSFDLLNHFFPSSFFLDKGPPIWHFQPLYNFFNIILPAYLWSSRWPL